MLPGTVRILVCTIPQDMRRSYDTLAAVVREVMKEEPQSGALYIFFGKRPMRVKVLWWATNGYCLLSKRLHRALFVVPRPLAGESKVRVDASALGQLLEGITHEKREQKVKEKAQRRLH